MAVAATELGLWALGIRSWVFTYLHKWPWLSERYALMFPLLLAMALLALRRWRRVRLHWITAALAGAVAGLTASGLALLFAQLVAAPERANFLAGLRREGGVVGFFFFAGSVAFLRTLGWLFGASASSLALGVDRLTTSRQRSRERNEESTNG